MWDTTIVAAICGSAFLCGYLAGKHRTLTVTWREMEKNMRQMEKMTRELELWKEKGLKPSTASSVGKTL